MFRKWFAAHLVVTPLLFPIHVLSLKLATQNQKSSLLGPQVVTQTTIWFSLELTTNQWAKGMCTQKCSQENVAKCSVMLHGAMVPQIGESIPTNVTLRLQIQTTKGSKTFFVPWEPY